MKSEHWISHQPGCIERSGGGWHCGGAGGSTLCRQSAENGRYPLHPTPPIHIPLTHISHRFSPIFLTNIQLYVQWIVKKRNVDILMNFWALGPVLRNAPRLSFFTFSSIPSIFSIRSLFIIVINLWASLPIISVIEPTIKISTMGSLPTASPGSRHCNIVALHHSV